MKRFVTIALIAILTVLVSFSFAEESQNTRSNLIFNNVTSFAEVKNELYIYADNCIYTWDEKSDVKCALSCALSGHLISDGNTLFLMDIYDGKLHLLSDEMKVTAQPIKTFEFPQELFEDNESNYKQIISYVLTPNYLYILLEGENPLWRDLFVFEYYTGKYAFLENLDVYAIGKYQSDSIIAASYDITGPASTCEFRLYNGLSSHAEILFELKNRRPENLEYQQETDSLFLKEGDVIYAYDFLNQPQIVGKDISLSGQLKSIVSDTYIYLTPKNELRSLPLNMDDKQLRTLTFAGSRSVNMDDNPAFSSKYPNVVISFRNDISQVDYATELITNTNAADIYCLKASSQTYRSLVAKGYAAPLTSNQKIVGYINQMYPQFKKKLTTEGGDIVAIPFGDIDSLIQYAYDPAVWKKAGITEIPTTVEEFLRLCQYFAKRDDLLEDGWHFSRTTDFPMLKKEILQLILQVYITDNSFQSEMPSFSMPDFIELLTLYEETLPALESICLNSAPFALSGYNEHEIMEKSLFSAPGADLLPEATSSSHRTCRNFLLLTIKKDSIPTMNVDMTVFIVNALSPNIDLAIEYLELYMDGMNEREKIQYFPSSATPVEAYYYQNDKTNLLEQRTTIEAMLRMAPEENKAALETELLSIEKDLELLEKNRWAISSETIDIFKTAVEYMKVFENIGINFFMSSSIEMISLLNQYIDGAIGKEKFATRYIEMIKMIFLEKGY